MKSAPFASSLVFAGILLAGAAQAETPYSAWSQSDDDSISVADSFNHSEQSSYESAWSSSVSEDNDVAVDLRNTHSEDNDITKDFDYTSIYETSEDNDVTTTTTTTEDNDGAVDFQFATPTLTSHKYQDQDAGHQADTSVLGYASGHDTAVQGGTTMVSAGNDETVYYGPALVNTNTNQLPQNNLFIQGSNGAPISQANTFAGRDMGPKGVFAPVGNTSVGVSGNVGNQSGASVDQSGDAANAISDPMSAVINR